MLDDVFYLFLIHHVKETFSVRWEKSRRAVVVVVAVLVAATAAAVEVATAEVVVVSVRVEAVTERFLFKLRENTQHAAF